MSKSGAGYSTYSELNVMQMIGRAGRPQFDNSVSNTFENIIFKGIAVIMTGLEDVDHWQNLVNRKQPVESK